MKKLLLTLTLTLFTTVAFAQSTSVITGAGKNDTSLGKTKNIETTLKKSLEVIEETNNRWVGSITTSNEKLDTSKGQVQNVINQLNKRHDEFLITETDPQGASYEDYATKPVPVCTEELPRLTYKNNAWHCVKAIDCGQVTLDKDGNSIGIDRTGWIKQNSNPPKCVRRKGVWAVTDWKGCSNNKQTRTVKCVNEDSRETFTAEEGGTGNCSLPKPTPSRVCASN